MICNQIKSIDPVCESKMGQSSSGGAPKPSDLIKSIHEKALQVARRYKQSEVELIEIIQQADQHRVHYTLGYSSLFIYVTCGLGLSEEVAYTFIKVARKAREVPALKGKGMTLFAKRNVKRLRESCRGTLPAGRVVVPTFFRPSVSRSEPSFATK
jgi:hypothetical protein